MCGLLPNNGLFGQFPAFWGQLQALPVDLNQLPFLGLLFLPWATLMYVIVYPVGGFDWVWLGMAFLADLASYSGGAYNRRSVPGYTGP